MDDIREATLGHDDAWATLTCIERTFAIEVSVTVSDRVGGMRAMNSNVDDCPSL